MSTGKHRPAFTLIEILIVLGIIVAVAAIFVPVVLNLTERNQVPKAASLLENALSIAKSRAVAEKRASGIRLVRQADARRSLVSGAGFAWYDEIQYINDPGDYVEAWVWGFADPGPVPAALPPIPPPPTRTSIQPYWTVGMPSPGALPVGTDVINVASGPFTFEATDGSTVGSVTFNRDRLLFGPISMAPPNTWQGLAAINRTSQRLSFNYRPDLLDPNQPTGTFVDVPAVMPGDYIEISGVGQTYQIIAVSVNQGAFLNVNISANAQQIRVPVLVLDRQLQGDVITPLNSRPNYRIIRKPRVIPTLQPVKLPQDVVIDLTPTRQGVLGPNGDLDSNSQFFMSGVSKTGPTTYMVNHISGLTMAPVAPLAVAPPYVDIMFAPSGEMLPSGQSFGNAFSIAPTNRVSSFNTGTTGLNALWLHQWGDPNLWAAQQATAAQGNADNQALVSINARTGFIGSYPMTPLSISTDPLLYVRTGKARISADTGQ